MKRYNYFGSELSMVVTGGLGSITYPRNYYWHPHWDDSQTYSYTNIIHITDDTGTVSFRLSEFEMLYRSTNVSIIKLCCQ